MRSRGSSRRSPDIGLRETKKRELRERILAVAQGLFRRHGYEAVRTKDIAEQAGISEPTLFNYFPSKRAIIDALALEWLASASAQFRAPAAGKEISALDALRRIVALQARAIERSPKYARSVLQHSTLFTTGEAWRAPVSAERTQTLAGFDAMASLVRAGQTQGQIRPELDPRHVAEVLHGALRFVCQLWLTGYWKTREKLETRCRKTVDLVIEGIAVP